MAWIETVPPERATGLLRRIYDAAVRRAGKVYNVVRVQSLRPRVLRESMHLYLEIMHSRESGLSRGQREMLATTVSWANDCHY
ncbi:MAG: carboxymuconolactone decarboxylase family protein [Thermoanaerobaculia bacterium]|nr:carboxymuconolactone decarboxylase family protein [Thermoanaerobaculia bacterium]